MTNRSPGRMRRLASAAAVAALFMVAAHPAMASPLTFAQYFQNNGSLQMWTITTTGNTTNITATGSVSILFSGVPGLPFGGPENATFNFSASSSQTGNCGVACAVGDSYVEPGFVGSFSFIDNGGGAAQGKNLLSGTFTTNATPATSGGQFGASIGSTGASFRTSSDTSSLLELVLSSNYLDFTGQLQETASFSLSSLIPNFAVGPVTTGQAFPSGSFAAAGTGTFSSSPGPASTPEPASAMLIGGGLCGLALLVRRKKITASRP